MLPVISDLRFPSRLKERQETPGGSETEGQILPAATIKDNHENEIGECLEATCDTCGKACAGNRGWWKKVSYEHNEWDCTCRACALEYADFYETFDPNVFAEAESEVIAEEAKSHVIREKIGGAA